MEIIDSLNSSDTVAQWLFVKCLGINFLFAFWSLYKQVLGLYGSKGILPFAAASLENAVNKRKVMWRFPSIFWWRKDDTFIKGTALAGVIFSLLIFTPLPLHWAFLS